MPRFTTFPIGKPHRDGNLTVTFFTVETDTFHHQYDELSEQERLVVTEELGRIYDQAREQVNRIRLTPRRFDYQRAFSNVLVDFHILVGYVRRREANVDWIFCYCSRGEIADCLEHIFSESLMLNVEVL